MANKTRLYKADQLPGGKLWEPSESEKEVLCDIDPTNDVAESVLGLNDWLQKTTANLSQRSVTNMVEVMKNGTMPWFARQAKEFKDNIFKLARARVNEIKKCDDARAEVHRMGRKRAREELEEKAVKKMKRTEDELGRLATVKKAMTIEEVEEGLLKVQGSTKKKTEKAELKYLRDQIYIHTQKKPRGKQTALTLRDQLENIISQYAHVPHDSPITYKIGLELLHKLRETDGMEDWYEGTVTSTSDTEVTITYKGYSDDFTWSMEDLQQDKRNGDLVIK